MATLLHIDASVREARSLSRGLSAAFMAEWTKRHGQARVIRRDVGRAPPPLIDQDWIAACFTPPDRRDAAMRAVLAPSDELIGEVEAADIIVLGTPMYNYGMPTPLKAWIDQMVRIDRTFSFDLARGDFPLAPILSGKTLVLLTACGEFGFGPGGVRAAWNHLDTHIRTCAPYLGVSVERFHHIAIEYQEFGGERLAGSIAAAHAAIPPLVDRLSVAPLSVDRLSADRGA